MVEWKIKGLYKADAEDVYQEITSIGDEVTPEQIVEKAKDVNTALHSCFEWNNQKAAHKYRLIQAQRVILNINFIQEYEDDKGEQKMLKVRAIVCKNERKNTYQTVQNCIEDPESYARLRAAALKDMLIFKQRYEKYSSLLGILSDVFKAMDEAMA